METKPILFNTKMVRAILYGRKTVTRLTIKAHNCEIVRAAYCCQGEEKSKFGVELSDHGFLAAPYHPGDILYVRETWFEYAGQYVYKATAAQPGLWDGFWRPSIHMPKEAARIFLRVTSVSAQRLQKITISDCVAEGAVQRPHIAQNRGLVAHTRYRDDFASLWDSTIKKRDLPRFGWDANPWVWVIRFERCSKPDEYLNLEKEAHE